MRSHMPAMFIVAAAIACAIFSDAARGDVYTENAELVSRALSSSALRPVRREMRMNGVPVLASTWSEPQPLADLRTRLLLAVEAQYQSLDAKGLSPAERKAMYLSLPRVVLRPSMIGVVWPEEPLGPAPSAKAQSIPVDRVLRVLLLTPESRESTRVWDMTGAFLSTLPRPGGDVLLEAPGVDHHDLAVPPDFRRVMSLEEALGGNVNVTSMYETMLSPEQAIVQLARHLSARDLHVDRQGTSESTSYSYLSGRGVSISLHAVRSQGRTGAVTSVSVQSSGVASDGRRGSRPLPARTSNDLRSANGR